MLAQRDQWVRAFPWAGTLPEEELIEIRHQLESPFRQRVQQHLGQLRETLAAHPVLVDELLELSTYACQEPGDLDIGILDRFEYF